MPFLLPITTKQEQISESSSGNVMNLEQHKSYVSESVEIKEKQKEIPDFF